MPNNTSEYQVAANLIDYPFTRNLPRDYSDSKNGIWAGHTEVKDKILRTINHVRADKYATNSMQFVFGDYGCGKTHALRWILYYILHEKNDEFDSAVYLMNKVVNQSKVDYKWAYENYILNGSNMINDLMDFTRWFNKNIITQHPDYTEVDKREVIESLFGGNHGMSGRINELMSLPNINSDNISDFLQVKNEDEAVANIILYLSLFTYKFDHEGLDYPRQFKKAVYLMIDELDLTTELPTKEIVKNNLHIRRMTDEIGSCFSLILAATATAAERDGMLEMYNITRLDDQTGISIPIMISEEAETFIKELLEAFRIDPNKKGKIGNFPFCDQFIDEFIESTPEISARIILSKLGLALRTGEIEDLDISKNLIDSKFILKHHPEFFDF